MISLRCLRSFVCSRATSASVAVAKARFPGGLMASLRPGGGTSASSPLKSVFDEAVFDSPTHKVDCFKNGVGVEIEWNNKTEFAIAAFGQV